MDLRSTDWIMEEIEKVALVQRLVQMTTEVVTGECHVHHTLYHGCMLTVGL